MIDLNKLYKRYKYQYSDDDPVWDLHNFKNEKDIEILGLISSCYSYGLIDIINKFISRFLNIIENQPYKFISNFDLKNDRRLFKGMNYRFNNENDLLNLIENIRVNLIQFGSLKNLFLKKYSPYDENILKALNFFSTSLRKKYVKNLKGYEYLVPDVSKGSTCKRLNLFLRWMVRKDEIDLGIWSDKIDKSKLIMPVDIHVYRQSKKYRLVKRSTCDMKFAIELTTKLKKFDSSDPVKYDFALCHDDI